MHKLSNIVAIITLVLFMNPVNADATGNCDPIARAMLESVYDSFASDLSLGASQDIMEEYYMSTELTDSDKKTLVLLYKVISEALYIEMINKPATVNALKTNKAFRTKSSDAFIAGFCEGQPNI